MSFGSFEVKYNFKTKSKNCLLFFLPPQNSILYKNFKFAIFLFFGLIDILKLKSKFKKSSLLFASTFEIILKFKIKITKKNVTTLTLLR